VRSERLSTGFRPQEAADLDAIAKGLAVVATEDTSHRIHSMIRWPISLMILCGALLVPVSARADIDLWPLLEVSDESTTVLYPLYVREGKFLMIFPLYYRTNEGRDHHLLWPMLKESEGRVTRVVPLWFSEDQSTFTLFPLIRQTPEYTLWSVPPTYFRRDRSFRLLFPFYARSGSFQLFFPLYVRAEHFESVFPLYARSEHWLYTFPTYYREREPGKPQIDLLWPLFRWKRDDDQDVLNIAWRLFGWDRARDERKLWAGYLFHRERASDSWWDLIFPVYSAYREGNKRGFLLLPYYQVRAPNLSTTGVLPIFKRHREADTKSLLLIPYYQLRSPDESKTALFPFVWRSRKIDETSSEVSESLSMLWPAYKKTERRSAEGELRERYRRFLIFSDRLDRTGIRTFQIFGIPISERTR
jgi:hypothetical protein